MKRSYPNRLSRKMQGGDEEQPRPLILALMLTGILILQVYPTLWKTVIEKAEAFLSTSVELASHRELVPQKFSSMVSEVSADPITSNPSPNLACQRQKICTSFKLATESVLPVSHIRTQVQPPQLTLVSFNPQVIQPNFLTQTTPASSESLPSAIAKLVRQDLAQQAGISPEKLTITESSPQTWSDSCLGLAQSGEMCAQVLVKGWRVVVSDGQQVWVYRTDTQGKILRLEPSPNLSQLPPSVTHAIFQDVAERTGLPHSALRIMSVQPQTWLDGCLGLGEPGAFCTLAWVPGWNVGVASGKQRWIYRSNQSGSVIRIDDVASHWSEVTHSKLIHLPDYRLLTLMTNCRIPQATYRNLLGQTCNRYLRTLQ